MESLNAAESILPNSAEVMAYKGFVHFFLGAMQNAFDCWKRAAQIDPRLSVSFKAIGLTI